MPPPHPTDNRPDTQYRLAAESLSFTVKMSVNHGEAFCALMGSTRAPVFRSWGAAVSRGIDLSNRAKENGIVVPSATAPLFSAVVAVPRQFETGLADVAFGPRLVQQ